jgi:hypothetical protein
MAFLSPWMLAALGALAVPLLVHLWRRRQAVPVPFGTLRFLKVAAARTRRRARLENVLLLLLRCAIFALVALAAARPVLPPQPASWLVGGSGGARTAALIIDRSMSMGYRMGDLTRLEEAKRQARLVLDDLRSGDGAAVIAADGHARLLIAQPTTDHALTRRMIDSVAQGEGGTDFAPALREARKLLTRAPKGARQVWLFTDSQAAGWRHAPEEAFGAEWKAAGIQLFVVRPDDLTAPNAALTGKVRFDPPFAAPGTTVRGRAVVENFSSVPLHDVLEITVDERPAAQQAVDAEAGSAAEAAFEFEAPPGAAEPGHWVRGGVRLSGDRLPSDDRRYFVLPTLRRARALVVEGQRVGPERLHAGAFLRRALAVGAGGGGTAGDAALPTAIRAEELDGTTLEAYSAVFLADVGRLGDRALVRLERYLQGGGTVVCFGGGNVSAAEFARWEFLPAKASAASDLPLERLPARLTEPGHPIFAGEWDANTPFPALPQKRALDWKPETGAKTLITLGEDVPFIIVGERGAGRTVIVNASADRAWGDFPLTGAFVPLMQQIARWSASPGGGLGELDFVVGEPVHAAAYLPRDQPLTLVGPDQESSALPTGESRLLLERAERSGCYEVRSANGETLQAFAVNPDARESDLHPLEESALMRMAPAAQSAAGFENLRLFLARNRGATPLWPALLLLALAAFVAESILSNLLARNRSQANAAPIRTGRLHRRRMGVSFRAEEKPSSSTGSAAPV